MVLEEMLYETYWRMNKLTFLFILHLFLKWTDTSTSSAQEKYVKFIYRIYRIMEGSYIFSQLTCRNTSKHNCFIHIFWSDCMFTNLKDITRVAKIQFCAALILN